jgi:hypothetical protein
MYLNGYRNDVAPSFDPSIADGTRQVQDARRRLHLGSNLRLI